MSERVTDIIKQCLRAHGGSFDPSQIRHKIMGLSRGEERMYARLNKLLQPGQLRPFLDRHPEFAWQQKGPRGMVVTWADAVASGASAPGTASAAAPSCAAALASGTAQAPGSANAAAPSASAPRSAIDSAPAPADFDLMD